MKLSQIYSTANDLQKHIKFSDNVRPTDEVICKALITCLELYELAESRITESMNKKVYEEKKDIIEGDFPIRILP